MLRKVLLCAATATVCGISAAPSHAQDSQASWRVVPSAQMTDYPAFAQEFGFSGRTALECIHDPAGVVRTCEVLSEVPEGLGFGAAAVSVVRRGSVNPPTENGVPVGARFTVRIPFNMMGETPEFRPWQGPEPDAASIALAEQFIAAMGPLPPMYDPAALESLTPDRRKIVSGFVEEAFPSQQEMSRIAARGMARIFPATALKSMMEGRSPSEDDIRAINQAGPQVIGGLFDVAAANAEVRSRYCARFHCGDAPQ